MNLTNQILDIVTKGFSIHLIGLPGFGITHFLKDTLTNRKEHKFLYFDCNLPLKNLPQSFSKPTTILLDHFDHLLTTKNTNFFRKLRFLRNENKYKLSFIIATNHNHNLYPHALLLDSFYEIISENFIHFPALSKQESQTAINYFQQKLNLSNQPANLNQIYTFSGGIPSLIKTHLLGNTNSRTQGVLNRLWQALGKENQDILRTQQPNNDLISWRLINKKGQVISSALKKFALSQILPDQEIQKLLTATEFRLFKKLKQKQNQIISRDDLILAGWPDDESEGVSDQALDQAILRLRKKLKNLNYFIQTIKGQGFILNKL